MTEPTRTSTGIAYLTFDATLNTDASMIIQQKLDLSGNTNAQTFCENAFDLAAGEDISGALLADSDITDYNTNNLVYLGSNDVNVQKTFLNNKLNSSIAQNIACNAYEMTLGKNNQIPLVNYLEQEPEPEPEPEPIPEPEPEPEPIPEPEPEPEPPYSLTTFNITNQRWRDITSSNDGQYIFACGNDGIWTSTDYGQSWTETWTQNKDFRGIQCSANGQTVACCLGYYNADNLHYSSNYGATFTFNTSGYSMVSSINHMDMDKSGKYLIGGSTSTGGGWTGYWKGTGGPSASVADATNGWQNFYHNSGTYNWTTCSMSYNGQYMLIVLAASTKIYISSDYGSTWTLKKTLGNTPYSSLVDTRNTSAMSETGQYMVYADEYNGIWLSTDYGNTWNQKYNHPTTVMWIGSAMSSDGSYIVACGYNEYVYVSTDYGENWEQLTDFGIKSWRKMAINASNEVYLTEYNGKLYKLTATN